MPDQVPAVARYFTGREEQFEGISNRALALLVVHDWPGNVRELEHAIEYAMISTTSNRIERAFLPASIREIRPIGAPDQVEEPADSEGDRLQRALTAHRWNATATARTLGVSRTTLWRRMRRAGLLDRP